MCAVWIFRVSLRARKEPVPSPTDGTAGDSLACVKKMPRDEPRRTQAKKDARLPQRFLLRIGSLRKDKGEAIQNRAREHRPLRLYLQAWEYDALCSLAEKPHEAGRILRNRDAISLQTIGERAAP